MAVRQLAFTESHPVEQTTSDVKLDKKPRKEVAVMSLIDILPKALYIFLAAGISLLILSRYAYVNQLQIDIFNASQSVKAHQQDIYKLNIQCDSFMTINEIQAHANNELGMILPTEKNKVVIKISDYYILDKTVAFKGSNTKIYSDTNQGAETALK